MPYFGLSPEGQTQCCSGCTKGHTAVLNVRDKKCEGCRLEQPTFGLPAEGKKRWRAGCAKAHAGAVDVAKRKAADEKAAPKK